MTTKTKRRTSGGGNGKTKAVTNASTARNIGTSGIRRVFNALIDRTASSLLGLSHDGKRDIYDIYGWPKENARSFELFWDTYKQGDIAKTVVDKIPRSCWRDGATVTTEPEGEDNLMDGVLAPLNDLRMFTWLERADVLNRIGSFSVLFVGGLPGQTDQEVISGLKGNLEPVYFSAFAENSVQVKKYDMNIDSPRYGAPETYSITPRAIDSDKVSEQRQDKVVHWSRIVHMAENAITNDIDGFSALDPVYNAILDYHKVRGGSAEAYFRNAMLKLISSTELPLSPEEVIAFQTIAEEWLNEQKSFLAISGAKMDTVQITHADPTGTAELAIQSISATTGIPKRILTGEGAGQLAGNEDKASYNQIISDRQNQICEPWLRRLFSILDEAGAIKLPDRYFIEWPLPEAMDEKTAADVGKTDAEAAKLKVETVSLWAMSGLDSSIPAKELSEIVGVDVVDVPSPGVEPMDGDGDGDE